MLIQDLIKDMMLTKTWTHMLDSGWEDGRHWQRNQDRIFEDESVVECEWWPWFEYTINLYWYLTNNLTLDTWCEEFNSLPCPDWESQEAYGLSQQWEDWLKSNWFIFKESFNSYNWDTSLSQVIQWTWIENERAPYAEYLLLQIHQGADVRWGYTDAKLVRLQSDKYLSEDVWWICKVNGEEKVIDNYYDWVNLRLSSDDSLLSDLSWVTDVQLQLTD